jgi:hypothetical protein
MPLSTRCHPDFEMVVFVCNEVREIRSWYNAIEANNGGCQIMTAEQFDQALSQFKHREPFEPFVVELHDGRVIEIVQPDIAFYEGFASFFTPDSDLVNFAHEDVREIRSAAQGVAR